MNRGHGLLINANALRIPLADQSVQVCVTSPPYFGLRDYKVKGQIGLEDSIASYVDSIVQVSREVNRVLRDDGTYWLNIGDSYAGSGKGQGGKGIQSGKQVSNKGSYFEGNNLDRRSEVNKELKPKNLCMIPSRVALALQDDGWYLRTAIVWAKPNPMPESVTDRPTRSYEMIYLLTKSARYYYDQEAVKEPMKDSSIERNQTGWNGNNQRDYPIGSDEAKNQTTRNQRDVWTITPEQYDGAHYAVFPSEIPRRAILAGSKQGDIILDPFVGSGTTVMVARELGRHGIGLDLSLEYLRMNATPRAMNTNVAEAMDDLPLFGGLLDSPEKIVKQDGTGNPTYTGFNDRWSNKQ